MEEHLDTQPLFLSEMSEISSTESRAPGGEEQGSKIYLVTILGCCFLLALIVAVMVGINWTDDGEEVSDDDIGSIDDVGDDSPSNPPARHPTLMTTLTSPTNASRNTEEATTEGTTLMTSIVETTPAIGSSTATNPTTSTTTTTTTTISTSTTTTTTSTAAPVKEIICTLGATAAIPLTYPKDGMCKCVYYTHVFIYKGEVMPTGPYTSFEFFLKFVSSYWTTQGGLSFDIRYINKKDITTNKKALRELWEKNIYNFGFLGMIAPIQKLEEWVRKARAIFKELRSIHEDRTARRNVIAIGTLNYVTGDTWPRYSKLFEEALAKDYHVDVVIAVSSTVIEEELGECKVLPPATESAAGDDYGSFNKLKDLVKKWNKYSDPYKIVGMSLGMGALSYRYYKNIQKADEIELYEACTEPAIVPVDVACESKKIRENYASTNVAIMRDSDIYILLWESSTTMGSKVNLIKNLPPWHRFAWLVYNVHLVDTFDSCKLKDKFQFLLDLRAKFGMR